MFMRAADFGSNLDGPGDFLGKLLIWGMAGPLGVLNASLGKEEGSVTVVKNLI